MLRQLRVPTMLGALFLIAATSLQAQQAQATAPDQPAAEVAAPAAQPSVAAPTPAPRPSPLFEQQNDRAPTIAPKASENSAMSGGRHTFTISTTVLVLSIIILVLLID